MLCYSSQNYLVLQAHSFQWWKSFSLLMQEFSIVLSKNISITTIMTIRWASSVTNNYFVDPVDRCACSRLRQNNWFDCRSSTYYNFPVNFTITGISLIVANWPFLSEKFLLNDYNTFCVWLLTFFSSILHPKCKTDY